MQTQIVRPGHPLWEECLAELPHDFYHRPAYLAISARCEAGEPLAFVAEEDGLRMLLPLIARPIDDFWFEGDSWRDMTSPYGFPSPLVSRTGDAAVRSRFLSAALDALVARLREERVVSLFLRMHPLLPVPLGPFSRHGKLVHHGETVYIDLRHSEDKIWRHVRKQFRSRINRALRNGCRAEIDEEWRYLDDFIDVYAETMQRVEASGYYLFPREYFTRMRDELPGVFRLCVARVGEEVAAAGLFSEVGGIVQAHLCGMRIAYAEHDPSKVLMNHVWRWARARGNDYFHLGGGVGAGSSSLAQFKTGFSKLRGDFCTWRAIVNAPAYDAIVRAWQDRGGHDGGDLSGFFPPYRRPVLEPAAIRGFGTSAPMLDASAERDQAVVASAGRGYTTLETANPTCTAV